jgi:hypothetical protein
VSFAIAMLRDGYELLNGEEGPDLCIRTKRGYCWVPITQNDKERGKLRSVIAKFKRSWHWRLV